MEQNPPPHNVVIDWSADYTHYICDQFRVPRNRAEGLLQQYLNLMARGHPQQPAASSYEQPIIYPEPPDPLHQVLIREQHLNPHLDPRLKNQPLSDSGPSSPHHEPFIREQPQDPHLATQFQDQPMSYSEPSSTRCEPLPREQLQDPHLATQLQDQPMSHSARFSSHYETDGGDEADDLSTLMATTAPNEAPRTQFFPYDQQPWNNMNIDSGFPEAAAPSSSQTRTPNPTTVGTITDYDPLWVQKDNVDPVQVENFNSAMQFDTLCSQGVIKLDDVLTFQVSVTTNGQEEETEAHLKVELHSLLADTHGANLTRSQAIHDAQPLLEGTRTSQSASSAIRVSDTLRLRPAEVRLP